MESKNMFDLVTTKAMLEALNFCSHKHHVDLEGFNSIPEFVDRFSISNPTACYSLLETFKKSLVRSMANYMTLYEEVLDKDVTSNLEQFCAWMIAMVIKRQKEIKKLTVH